MVRTRNCDEGRENFDNDRLATFAVAQSAFFGGDVAEGLVTGVSGCQPQSLNFPGMCLSGHFLCFGPAPCGGEAYSDKANANVIKRGIWRSPPRVAMQKLRRGDRQGRQEMSSNI